MARKKYDPADDPIVQRLLAAKHPSERRAIEREAVTQSDNGPKDTDPREQPRAPRRRA